MPEGGMFWPIRFHEYKSEAACGAWRSGGDAGGGGGTDCGEGPQGEELGIGTGSWNLDDLGTPPGAFSGKGARHNPAYSAGAYEGAVGTIWGPGRD